MHVNLRGLSRVEDELSEISLINQILKISSKGSTVDVEMAHPVMEDAVLPRSGSLRVLRERSTRAPGHPSLVFDGVKHIVDGNPEWKVGLCGIILIRLICVSGWFMDSNKVVVWVLPRRELLLQLLAFGALFRGGDWLHPESPL